MTVDEVLALARSYGVKVTLEGDELQLEADAPPPSGFLAVLGRGKWDIVAVLRQREAEERRRVLQWVNDHITSSPAGICAHCGAVRRKRSRRCSFFVSRSVDCGPRI
jgi:hypothetical protein